MCKSCGCGSKKSHRKPAAKKAAPRKKAAKKAAPRKRKGY